MPDTALHATRHRWFARLGLVALAFVLAPLIVLATPQRADAWAIGGAPISFGVPPAALPAVTGLLSGAGGAGTAGAGTAAAAANGPVIGAATAATGSGFLVGAATAAGVATAGLASGYLIGTAGVNAVEGIYDFIRNPRSQGEGFFRGDKCMERVCGYGGYPYDDNAQWVLNAQGTANGDPTPFRDGNTLGIRTFVPRQTGGQPNGVFSDITCRYRSGKTNVTPAYRGDSPGGTEQVACPAWIDNWDPILAITGNGATVSVQAFTIPVGVRVDWNCRVGTTVMASYSEGGSINQDSGSFTIPAVTCPAGQVPTDIVTIGVPSHPGKPSDPGLRTETGPSGPKWDPSTPQPAPGTQVVPLSPTGTPMPDAPVDPDTGEYPNPDPSGDPSTPPNKIPSPGCTWGSLTLTAAQCYPNPTSPNPNDPPPTPNPGSTPGPTPDPSPSPGGDPGTDPGGGGGGGADPTPRECFPNGWGVFNPVEWVYMPVKCALVWAFVPSTTVATQISDLGTQLGTKTPVPELGSIVTWFEPPVRDNRCLDLAVQFPSGTPLPERVQVLNSCDSSNPVVDFLVSNRTALSAVIWMATLGPLAWWAWREYAPGAKGVA